MEVRIHVTQRIPQRMKLQVNTIPYLLRKRLEILQYNIKFKYCILLMNDDINNLKNRLIIEEKLLCKRIEKLPSELINIIYTYIPNKVCMLLERNIYIKSHGLLRKYIMKDQYENYIRAMIRRDNDFVFSLLIHENFEKWLFFKKYVYKLTLFSNYIYFLLEYSIENDAEKCKQIINNYIIKSGLSKNQHKKNTSKNIRWTN